MIIYENILENVYPFNTTEKPKSEAEILREKNIKDREAFFASLLQDPKFSEAVSAINSTFKDDLLNKNELPSKVKRKRKSNGKKDQLFKFFGNIPTETRRSLRLKNESPLYNELDGDCDISANTKRHKSDTDFDDIEEVVWIPRKKRSNVNRDRFINRLIISVEDVTNYMLSKVVKRVSEKQYSQSGTSCHQCRQKTDDQKTCCRNEQCFGVRGQFCGVCLENR